MKIELKLKDYQGKDWLPLDRRAIQSITDMVLMHIRQTPDFKYMGVQDAQIVVTISADEMELRGWK